MKTFSTKLVIKEVTPLSLKKIILKEDSKYFKTSQKWKIRLEKLIFKISESEKNKSYKTKVTYSK